MKLKHALLSVAAFLFLALPRPAAAITLSVGVVPQQSAAELVKAWVPLLAYLGERAGLRLQFETAKDIPTFEQRLAKGEYDIAYMNPYHYVVFHAAPGYQAFAREKDRRIQGIVVVPKASKATRLEDLAGQAVAFPAPAAFAATILPLAHLKTLNVPVKPTYTSSHDSVYLGVARGFFPAGGGINRTFENIAPEVRDGLRILWKSPSYTPHAFAAHPKLKEDIVRRLLAAMAALDSDPRGRELLAGAGFKGFEEGRDADWNDIRKLGIRLLENLHKAAAGEH
ncbi:MAG: phosphate/phosphite/phosphonate ABC transporter substrate-binding protein [Desulfovibrio sp.]|jgi:phosphonate transport system substrate-binding protein|nr:phosphate/phosphite/phosphonate ABC transporter substrate-binding protein [Desulfovibrio sp.]